MIQNQKLQQVVDPNRIVRTINPEATVTRAAAMLNEYDIGCLVVVDEGGDIVGIVSERDIVSRVVATARDPHSVRVSDVMSTNLVVCSPDTPIVEAQRIMTERVMRHLPVVKDEKLVGIISGRDILTHQLLATTVLMLQGETEPAAH